MAKGRRYGGSRRGLTDAQRAANDRAWDECDHYIGGSFSRGAIITDSSPRLTAWKINTYGRKYHEDCPCDYGVVACRGPKGWTETVLIRAAIKTVLETGTHEPGSRGTSGADVARPAGAAIASWTDRRYNSHATLPTITVYDGGVIGAVKPNYDDSPSVTWIRDAKLAKKILVAIQKQPTPVILPEANVRERFSRIAIPTDHPRYAEYLAVPRATPYDGGVNMPHSELRAIKDRIAAAKAEPKE